MSYRSEFIAEIKVEGPTITLITSVMALFVLEIPLSILGVALNFIINRETRLPWFFSRRIIGWDEGRA